MADGSITLDATASFLFVGNSFTFGRVDPVMSYNTDEVRDLTAPVPGTTFENTTGSNAFEPHPWGGVPGIFKEFADQAGLTLDVALSTRNAASLQGHYLNSNPAGWDLRGNVASQAWDTLVLQDNSTQALPSGAATITFAAGSSVARIILNPVADGKAEGGAPGSGDPEGLETVGLQVASGTGYTVGTSSVLTGTIYDGSQPVANPNLPTVSVVASPSSVFEDGTENLVYTFTRTGPADTDLLVEFDVRRSGSTGPSVATSGANQDLEVAGNGTVFDYQSGGSATTGSVSFTSNTGSILIRAGQTSATLTLNPKVDATVEPDEWVRVTLLSPQANYNIGTTGAVQVTILNDDGVSGGTLPNITGKLANGTVYEDTGGQLVWEFTRTGDTSQALTVNLNVNGTATLTGGDFTVDGAASFRNGGAENPNLTSFQTYAVKLAQYATTGLQDGAVPANPNANAATNVFLYETWARPNLVLGALEATTDDTTGAVTTYPISAPEYYASLEDMTADLRAAYEGLGAANPIFKGVAPVGAAFMAAVVQGVAIRDPYTETEGDDVGNVNLWWDDNLHASKYGSYLSAATLFGTLTGIDPRSMGAGDRAAFELGIDPAVAAALQNVAAATLGFSLQANWTAPGQVAELVAPAIGTLATAGAFSFSDTSTTDVHAVSVTPLTVGARGTLTAQLYTDTTGDGTGGAVNWNYTVANSDIAFLVAGQTRIERFLVTLSDQNGGEAQREIAVTITGTNDGSEAGPNVLVGREGSDEFYGLGGNDSLFGLGGSDFLYGGEGSDALFGGAGADLLDGGADFDLARYDDAGVSEIGPSGPIGVIASLTDPSTNTGEAAGDTYVSIEGLAGSAYSDGLTGDAGDNVLFGNAGDDGLYGLDGNDALYGGVGGDLLNGGDGFDLARYDQAATGVVASLLDPSLNTGEAAGDIYLSIEGLAGSAFADTLTGDANNNLLFGNAGDDSLYGDGGNDSLLGGLGADLLDGGSGFDIARYDNAAGAVLASLLNPSANLGEAAGDSYVSIEGLAGSAFGDTLAGDAADNILLGNAGADLLFGNDGNDTLYGGLGADLLDGGNGFDIARYDQATTGVIASLIDPSVNSGEAAGDSYVSIEGLAGSAFGDGLVGNGSDNVLFGGAGSDALLGEGGNDALYGGLDADLLDGGSGFDIARYDQASTGVTASLTDRTLNTGEAGGDIYVSIEGLAGSAFADTLEGDANANILFGNAGDDFLYGSSGNDSLFGGLGADLLDGGAGWDVARYDNASAGVTASLGDATVNMGEAAGDSYVSIEGLAGSDFADTLFGDSADNVLYGNAGGDVLFGGLGNDLFYGGSGADRFDLSQELQLGAQDRILDFETQDVIALSVAMSGIETYNFDGTNTTVSALGYSVLIDNATIAQVQNSIIFV